MLTQFLDYQRDTLLLKIDGLDDEQLAIPLPTSSLTLAGLVKHLAWVEDTWFQDRFAGAGMPEPWANAPFDDDPDWDFHSAPGDGGERLVALYREACGRSRQVESVASLDQLSAGVAGSTGQQFTMRWILLHMIEETARHNGHADLLREAIDGTVGA